MNTRTEPAVRRLLARQRLCRMRMRSAGLLALGGYTPPEGSGVERIWKRHGWTPSNRVLTVRVEVRDAA